MENEREFKYPRRHKLSWIDIYLYIYIRHKSASVMSPETNVIAAEYLVEYWLTLLKKKINNVYSLSRNWIAKHIFESRVFKRPIVIRELLALLNIIKAAF